jgi:hypothetical protein
MFCEIYQACVVLCCVVLCGKELATCNLQIETSTKGKNEVSCTRDFFAHLNALLAAVITSCKVKREGEWEVGGGRKSRRPKTINHCRYHKPYRLSSQLLCNESISIPSDYFVSCLHLHDQR